MQQMAGQLAHSSAKPLSLCIFQSSDMLLKYLQEAYGELLSTAGLSELASLLVWCLIKNV